jgi:hypothetical protein
MFICRYDLQYIEPFSLQWEYIYKHIYTYTHFHEIRHLSKKPKYTTQEKAIPSLIPLLLYSSKLEIVKIIVTIT